MEIHKMILLKSISIIRIGLLLIGLMVCFLGCENRPSNKKPTNIEEPPPSGLCDCPETWTEIICWGNDTFGRKAKFAIAILTEEEQWVYNSDTTLEKTGSFRKNIPAYLAKLPYIKSSKGLICIGTASKDGTDSSEAKLARKRADEIVYIIRPLSNAKYDKYKINLGRYKTIGTDEADQRRVIIVGILSRDVKMNDDDLKFACYSALKEKLKKSIGLDIQNYQNFEFGNVGK